MTARAAIGVLALAICVLADVGVAAERKERAVKKRRILYNSDGSNIFTDKGDRMTLETLRSFVDEVAGMQVDTFLLCQGSQTFYYPTSVSERFGEGAPPEVRARWSPRLCLRVGNIERLLKQGVEPYHALVSRIHEKGMEAIFTFRLNEAHTVPLDAPHVSAFWREHPEWRLDASTPQPNVWGPKGARRMSMNFAIPEVRARRLAEMREALRLHDYDGLELDFQRWPYYFKPREIHKNIPTMTQFVRDVRRMADECGRLRGRPFVLGVRVLRTIAKSRAIGLDPATWAKEGLIDFLTASRFLHNNEGRLAVKEFKGAIPDIPIYGCIEFTANVDEYRGEARKLWADGVDGIYMFNFFCARQVKKPFEPPFFLLEELGDPKTIKP